MTTLKTIALSRWTFVSEVLSLLFNALSSFVIWCKIIWHGNRLLCHILSVRSGFGAHAHSEKRGLTKTWDHLPHVVFFHVSCVLTKSLVYRRVFSCTGDTLVSHQWQPHNSRAFHWSTHTLCLRTLDPHAGSQKGRGLELASADGGWWAVPRCPTPAFVGHGTGLCVCCPAPSGAAPCFPEAASLALVFTGPPHPCVTAVVTVSRMRCLPHSPDSALHLEPMQCRCCLSAAGCPKYTLGVGVSPF